MGFSGSPSGSARDRGKAPEGRGKAPASSPAEALDVVPGLPLDYAEVDRRSDAELELYRAMTDKFREILMRKRHKGRVFHASDTYMYKLVGDACLSTLQSMDRIGVLKMDTWSVQDFNTLLGRAAFHGHVDVLQWLNTRAREVHGEPDDGGELGFQMSQRTLYTNTFQQVQNPDVMKWIHANGCPHDENTFKYAVWFEDVEVMRWLYADGCPMNYLATAYAAMDGKIDMLKWLRDRGCEWNASACALAAGSGDLETLKYLRANGCPWNLATTLFAQRQARFADRAFVDPEKGKRAAAACRDVAAWAARNGLSDHKWYSENKKLTTLGDRFTKAALDSSWLGSWIDDVEAKELMDYKGCKWQDRDADIDVLIAFAMRQDLDVDHDTDVRDVPILRDVGFGMAALEAPPPPTMDLAGEAAEQIKAAKATVAARAAAASDAAALASGVDTLALRESEAKRSEA